MEKDWEVAALIDQAARNLDTLERLLENGAQDASDVEELRRRLNDLKNAYTQETDALTQRVLRRAVERRRGVDRRRKPEPEPEPFHSLP
jgi:hypothetical protein